MKGKKVTYQVIYNENGKTLEELMSEYLQVYFLQKEQEHLDNLDWRKDHEES